MANSIFSILPPLMALLMVVLTKKVLLSLGVGIAASALLLAIDMTDGFMNVIIEFFRIILNTVRSIFFEGNSLNTGNIYILLFLIVLGIVTAFVTITGGSKAFGDWAVKRVKTRTGAQLIAAIMGVIIFIDDYFNAIAVGQISRPITDRQKISRAKLAYIIDSTSAPICVVSPISSWGAYIIALIVPILTANEITGLTAFSAFIQMIPMNLYVWTTLLLVFISAIWNINFGPMKNHEERALHSGILQDPEKSAPGELKEDLPVSRNGKVRDLVFPIITLIIGTVGSMIWTGYQAAGPGSNIFTVFENTEVSKSLILGGSMGLAATVLTFLSHLKNEKDMNGKTFLLGIMEGTKSMLPAISILLFAWTISSLIGELQTGEYLAGLVQKSNMNIGWLPLFLYVVAGIISFATGSSWGSFGILLPIAAAISSATNIGILLPAMAAVLAGSVLGDHCSPISDTTILSSTGAGCNHIDHVMTQLPYAFVAAAASAIGYLVIGFTGINVLGLIVSLALIVLLAVLGSKRQWPAARGVEQH